MGSSSKGKKSNGRIHSGHSWAKGIKREWQGITGGAFGKSKQALLLPGGPLMRPKEMRGLQAARRAEGMI